METIRRVSRQRDKSRCLAFSDADASQLKRPVIEMTFADRAINLYRISRDMHRSPSLFLSLSLSSNRIILPQLPLPIAINPSDARVIGARTCCYLLLGECQHAVNRPDPTAATADRMQLRIFRARASVS